MSTKYKDEEWLAERYPEQTLEEIGEECGVNSGTVHYWVDKYGLNNNEPWKDEKTLREKYKEEGYSSSELGEMWDVTASNIRHWINKFDIESHSQSYNGKSRPSGNTAHHTTVKSGHEKWFTKNNGNQDCVPVHRLHATLKFDLEDMKGKHIHHLDHIPWDNRTENYELMTTSEHMRHHREEEYEITI